MTHQNCTAIVTKMHYLVSKMALTRFSAKALLRTPLREFMTLPRPPQIGFPLPFTVSPLSTHSLHEMLHEISIKIIKIVQLQGDFVTDPTGAPPLDLADSTPQTPIAPQTKILPCPCFQVL